MSKSEFEFDLPATLPDGWKWMPLEDLMDQPKQDIVDGPFGSNLKASEYVEAGVPIARLQNVDRNVFVHKNIKYVTRKKAEELSRHTFVPGDVLITKLGDPLGEACIAPSSIEHGVIVADLVRVRPAKSKVDRHYLTYAINSPLVARQFEKHTKGTTRPRVNLGMIRKLPIPVAPREMQAGIVAEIEKQFSRLDEAVANLKRVKANLKRYKAAVLKAAVEGRLVETEAELARRQGRSFETGAQLLQRILETRRSQWQGKGKYKEPTAPDTTGLPELPEGWVWASIDFVCEQIVDCPHSTARFIPDGYPCIDTTWMTEEGLAIQRARYVDEVTYQERIARLAPKPGDIVFAREGTIGTAILVPERMRPCLGQRVMLLRPSIHFLGSLLRYTLHSEIVRSQYLAQALGSTVPHINVGDVKAFRIPVPPLAEQHRIAAEVDRRLSILGGTESQADVNLQRSERLRQAILARAFSGFLVNRSIPREAIAASVGKR